MAREKHIVEAEKLGEDMVLNGYEKARKVSRENIKDPSAEGPDKCLKDGAPPVRRAAARVLTTHLENRGAQNTQLPRGLHLSR